MTDFHKNIFYYYRGAQSSEEGRDRQLEDNTTKALINTLENCGSTVRQAFLSGLGIGAVGTLNFELQKPELSTGILRNRPRRYLLVLLPKQKTVPDLNCQNQLTGGSRPDAWLYGEDFVTLVESKVDAPLDEDQLRRHMVSLRKHTHLEPAVLVHTWAEVHRLLLRILDGTPKRKEPDRLIISQFVQYLEWIGMTDFTGFPRDAFDYFVSHDNNEIRLWVRDTMRSFARELQQRLSDFDPFYAGFDLGLLRLRDDQCWVAFGPAEKKYRSFAHQTVTMSAYALDVFVNIELKKPMDRFRRRLRESPEEFRRIISEIPDPFTIRLEERRQRQVSLYDYHPISSVESYLLKHPDMEGFGIRYLESQLEMIGPGKPGQVVTPYLTLGKRISRDEAIELSRVNQGQGITEEVVRTMTQFHPLVEFANG